MSVGSPLVDPRVNAFVIAPIAPFKLSARPYVVPIESEITIKVLEPDRPCILVLDGQYETQVQSEGEIKFTASENPAELVRFSTDFYKRVSEKLVL
jgi:NAD+ kinase